MGKRTNNCTDNHINVKTLTFDSNRDASKTEANTDAFIDKESGAHAFYAAFTTWSKKNASTDAERNEFKQKIFPNLRTSYAHLRTIDDWIEEKMNSAKSEEKIAFYNRLHKKESNHAKYRNLEWDKPSPTIVAHLYKDGLMFIHPDVRQLRSITVMEAALLQSFPNDFRFLGSSGSCFKMIGNAVPPKLAENIAFAIAKQFDRYE